MANINAPRGLVPLRKTDGTPCIASNEYTISASDTGPIYKGDMVELTASGNVIEQIAAFDNTDNIGVFWGVSYKDAAGKQHFSPYWDGAAGKTDIQATVYDDPNIIFWAQCDTLAAGDVGALADIAIGTGVAKYGISGMYIDVGTGTGTTGKNIRIRKLIDDGENAYGAYAKVECTIYEHALAGAAGVGV